VWPSENGGHIKETICLDKVCVIGTEEPRARLRFLDFKVQRLNVALDRTQQRLDHADFLVQELTNANSELKRQMEQIKLWAEKGQDNG
jgi:hypothetical protein